jgi:hypothetical protein
VNPPYTPTLDEFIGQLTALREQHGGNVVVNLWDAEGHEMASNFTHKEKGMLYGFMPVRFVAANTLTTWQGENETDRIIITGGAEGMPIAYKHRFSLMEPIEGWISPHPTTGEPCEVVRVKYP